MINVRQEVGENWGRMVAVEIGTLVVNTGPEDLFDRIVRAPLEALTRDQLTAPITILVDALDESLAYTGEPHDRRTRGPGRGTARGRALHRHQPAEERTRPFPAAPLSAAVHAVARACRSRAARRTRMPRYCRTCRTTLSGCCGTRRCPACWPLAWRRRSSSLRSATRARETSSTSATSLQMMLDRPGPITLESLAAVPAGLDDIYLEFMQRLVPAGPRAWQGEYGRALGVLAIAQAPLPEDQIAAITVLSPVVTRSALLQMREVLETDESRLRASASTRYYCSLADFLLDRDRAEEYWLDAGGHASPGHRGLLGLLARTAGGRAMNTDAIPGHPPARRARDRTPAVIAGRGLDPDALRARALQLPRRARRRRTRLAGRGAG